MIAKDRLATAADIPTVDEAGLPGFYISIWHALWAPKGTPDDIIARLNVAVVSALASDRAPATCRSGPGDSSTRSAVIRLLGALQKAEIEKWWPIVKAAKIKAE